MLLGIAAATGGVTVLVVVSNQQEVPYSHRRHVVLTSSAYDLSMGTQAFNMVEISMTFIQFALPCMLILQVVPSIRCC